MSKGEKKGNREAKKPKQDKGKVKGAAAASPVAVALKGAASPKKGK